MSTVLSPRATLRARARRWQISIALIALLLWESGIRHGWLEYIIPSPQFWFSSPSAIGVLLWKLIESGRLAQHVWLTLSATLIGLLIGAVAGTVIGTLMASSRMLEQTFEPLWSALNAVPKIALAPALGALLGLGIESKVALAVMLVFFVFLFNTITGLRSCAPSILNSLRLMGSGRWQTFRMAMLPTLARWHLSALRISLGLALTAVVVGEFVAARGGVGFLIQYGSGTFNVAWCYAGIAVLGVMALALDTLIRLLQRWIMPWEQAA